jgi:L-arabinose isomerase
LRERLEEYLNGIARKLENFSIKAVNAGLVDNPGKARDAAELFLTNRVEAIFLYISTYALSHTVLPVAQKLKVPVIILNLQPAPAIDYERINALGDRGLMTGEWLAYCQACSVPEITGVFNNARVPYDIVTGWLEERSAWEEIEDWCAAVHVSSVLRNSRIGILGHYYCGMLDVYTDVTRLAAVFGCHFEILEMDKLKALRDTIGKEAVEKKWNQFEKYFAVSPECGDAELDRAALTSCALDALAAENRLGGLAYYYEGHDGNDHENIVTSIIAGTTLLTANHVPVAGECEVKNAVAMKIMDCFNAGGSFSEFYAVDFTDDVVLWGHDGPAHAAITEGESSVGPVLEIGNTNSRYRFSISAKDFINRWPKAGPAHHCAIGIGHIAGKIEKLAFF